MINVHTQQSQARAWLERYRGKRPLFACILGFTATCSIPGISAAGKTPADREYTAIADAEFLFAGVQPHPQHPLPPLTAGASPVYISGALVAELQFPLYIFNAGLPHPPTIPHIDLGGKPAACVSTGAALPLEVVMHLYQQGLEWGEKLAEEAADSYLILSECVVGGTTTALSILSGLGFDAGGKVNSSHPICNHEQKWAVVRQGLQTLPYSLSPLELVAAVGDPMQIVVAGMAIAASRQRGVLLAGGSQMLAVYALARSIAKGYKLDWQPDRVVVGTTRWVAQDPTGDTIALAEVIRNVPFLSTNLSFATARHPQLQMYERGFVKEGVGAGGAAIAASLYRDWGQAEILHAIEVLLDRSQEVVGS
jgi:uncharacterized protein (TIGR00303 family)